MISVDVIVSATQIDIDISSDLPQPIIYGTPEDWSANLDILLKWSPFSTEDELLQQVVSSKDAGSACIFNVVHLLIRLFPFFTYQFEDIGTHGTKVMIYNLWLNDEGVYELSFDDEDEVLTLSFRDQVCCKVGVLNVLNISSFILGVIGHTAPR